MCDCGGDVVIYYFATGVALGFTSILTVRDVGIELVADSFMRAFSILAVFL